MRHRQDAGDGSAPTGHNALPQRSWSQRAMPSRPRVDVVRNEQVRRHDMSSTKSPKRPLLKRTSTRVVLVIVALVIAAAFLLRPAPPPPARGSGQMMQAIVYHEYGTANVLRFEKTEMLL